MSTVTLVANDVNELIRKLQRVKDYVDWRKSMGFPMYQTDEEWAYSTQPDQRKVCPVCLGYYQTPIYQGFDVPRFFPSKRRMLDKGSLQIVYPNVHEDHRGKGIRGDCHCFLTWLHVIETITQRVGRDVEGLIK